MLVPHIVQTLSMDLGFMAIRHIATISYLGRGKKKEGFKKSKRLIKEYLPVVSLITIIDGSAIISFIATTLPCVNATALGNPVVPLENGNIARSLAVLCTDFKQLISILKSSASSANLIVPSGSSSLSIRIIGMEV